MHDVDAIMTSSPVIPVLVIDDAETALPLAEALVAGGLRVLEVTLRTAAAPEAIRRMASVPGAIVGAGTVLNRDDARRAVDAGATFLISPGLTEALGQAAADEKAAFLPGIASASDLMRGLEMGLKRFKFFPAEAAGGVPMLKSLGGPFGDVRFCPTGGVSPSNAASYLALPNVSCVGGSWLAPPAMVASGDWAGITALAKSAAALRA